MKNYWQYCYITCNFKNPSTAFPSRPETNEQSNTTYSGAGSGEFDSIDTKPLLRDGGDDNNSYWLLLEFDFIE